MAKLFISYSRKDSLTARKLIEALKAMGQDIWVDWEDIPPSSAWMDQIKQGIEGSDAFIFLISPDSVVSGYCNDEINHAKKNSKRIIPVVIRQVRPDETVDIIRQLNWIFMRENEEVFEDGLGKIKLAIELDFEWVEVHSRLQSRALEWERRKETSLLLRGRDLWTVRQRFQVADTKDPRPTELQKTYLQHSSRNERRNLIISAVVSFAALLMTLLAIFANVQRAEADRQRQEANLQRAEAVKYAATSEANRLIAETQRAEADENARRADANAEQARREKQIAQRARERAEQERERAAAQRSAALAQIYQTRPGELFTSTLLAIDSWQTDPSPAAEEILRENISLLPLPVRQARLTGRINTVVTSPDGKFFATASADGKVCAWQLPTGEELFCRASGGAVSDVVITPDSQTLIAGDDVGNLSFIDLQDGALRTPFPPGAPITDLDIQGGRDPRLVAVTTSDGRIAIVNWKTGQRIGAGLSAAGPIRFAVFSPNGLQIATGTESGIISVWNLNETNTVINTDKHNGEVLALAFSPDGRYLVSGGADGAAVVLDLKTGLELYRSFHSDQVLGITFSRDSKRFVTVSKDRYIRVWDSATGKQLLTVSQGDAVRAVRLTQDGRWILTAGDDRTARVWNAATGTEFLQIPLAGRGTAVALSQDDKLLITGDQSGMVSLWDISTLGGPDRVLHLGAATDAHYSPTGSSLVVVDDRQVWLLNPRSIPAGASRPAGTPIQPLRGALRSATFSAQETWLALLSVRNEIIVFSLRNSARRTISPANEVVGLAFSPDETKLLTADVKGNVQVWDIASSRLVDTPVKYGKPITALAAAPGRLILGLQAELHVLDLNTGQELQQPAASWPVEALASSPDGSWLAATNANGQVQIWAWQANQYGPPRTVNKGNGSALAFSPQNDRLALGADGALVLLDPVNLEEAARIPISGRVTGLDFSQDGGSVMAASQDNLQFWKVAALPSVTPEDLVTTACRRLVENLSLSQWQFLFRDETYAPLCPALPVPSH